MKAVNILLNVFFYLLFFAVPLILIPFTSEIFEFNKIVTVYILTVIILLLWAIKSILSGKVIFKRTILDKPILIFLVILVLSTLVSLDTRISVFGYYSRFNGGLMSWIVYFLLYWAFVSNLGKAEAKKAIYCLAASSLIVSSYGVLQHYGIDKSLWVQDVQNRVFSTLGQPNWLAAWLCMITPIFIGLFLTSSNKKSFYWLILSSLNFSVLLFTKSRSGILGFGISMIIFGILYLISEKITLSKASRPYWSKLLIIFFSFVFLTAVFGSPWTPKISDFFQKEIPINSTQQVGTVLDTGGTESGEIRKIVWEGALSAWKNNLLIGTGPETFALIYSRFRPNSHNLTSEWDYVYNKAHNELLNIAVTTGSLGLLGYLSIVLLSIYLIFKIIKFNSKSPKNKSSPYENFILMGILSGYIGFQITNIFGFSVVPTQLLFVLFPALAVALSTDESLPNHLENKEIKIKILSTILLIIVIGFYLLSQIVKYWYADHLYIEGKRLNKAKAYIQARKSLQKAVEISPNEALYWIELSGSAADIALYLNEVNEKDEAVKILTFAAEESDEAVRLSPNNSIIKRDQSVIFDKLSLIDPLYLEKEKKLIEEVILLAPNDPKLRYRLGVISFKQGDTKSSLSHFQTAIEQKPNFKDARFAKAQLLIEMKNYKSGVQELEYILLNIDPNDAKVIELLEKIKTKV